MPDLAESQDAPGSVHDVVRRPALRLVNNQRAIE
jgi:hypothetical protein